jgi:hypothetical protein
LRFGRLPFFVGDTAHHQGDPRVVEIERHLRYPVPRPDRRAGDAQVGHRQTGLGADGQVECDDAGIAGQRVQAVTLAPSGKGSPGRAIGAPRAVARGFLGVSRGVELRIRSGRQQAPSVIATPVSGPSPGGGAGGWRTRYRSSWHRKAGPIIFENIPLFAD